MWCQTGVCGPSVDQQLLDVREGLRWAEEGKPSHRRLKGCVHPPTTRLKQLKELNLRLE
ncbi:MAG: Arsenical resistance operon protein ArsD [Microbacteriaceae bacterium]|jgi:hypothetical protein|nr:Arsenical resistance operon protein ArsD [Microbacteriaceae bacterium]